MSDSIYKQQLAAVAELEKSLGLKPEFFKSLRSDDDWSFVIKLHALIESSLGRFITAVFSDFALDKYFLTVDLCGGRHSKIKLLQELNQIDADECKFIVGLSTIRNRLVHNITHIQFDLQKYVNDMSATERRKFALQTCCIFSDSSVPESEQRERIQDILKRPKLYLWLCALHVVSCACLRTDTAQYKTQISKTKQIAYDLERERAKHLLETLKAQ